MADGTSPSSSSESPLYRRPLESHHIAQDHSPARRPGRSGTRSSVDSSSHFGRPPRKSDASNSNQTITHTSSSRTAGEPSNYLEPASQHGTVRTLPPWIDSFERGEDDDSQPTDRLLAPPSHAHVPQHHYAATKLERRVSHDGWVDDSDTPSPGGMEKIPERGLFGVGKDHNRGRKWDHIRERDPFISRSVASQPASPWKNFVKSSMYGPAFNEDGEIKSEEFLRKQTPGYLNPWRGDVVSDDPEKSGGLFHSKKRRRMWYERLQNLLLMHPLVPLAFRVTVLGTSAIALGLSGSIYNRTRSSDFPQNPSTVMAIVVDVVAMPYIGYVTWDEYTGKPLGLRSPKAKMRLVLLDLFFIMFESANLALAFATLTSETGSCEPSINGTSPSICGRVRTLCGFLFMALLAWCFTFTVSIFRLVERVGGREDPQ